MISLTCPLKNWFVSNGRVVQGTGIDAKYNSFDETKIKYITTKYVLIFILDF